MSQFTNLLKKLFTIEDPDNFNKRWSGIQSIATIALVIIGGSIWTLYNTAARANLELEALKYKEGALDFEMNAQDQTIPNDPAHYIQIVTHIKNVGNRDVLMCFEDPDAPGKGNCDEDAGDPCHASSDLRPLVPPIHIARATLESNQIVFSNEHEITTASMYRDDCPKRPVSELRIQPGQTEKYVAVARVEQQGLYRISFFAYLTKEEREIVATSSRRPLPANGRTFWSGETYLNVTDTATPKPKKH